MRAKKALKRIYLSSPHMSGGEQKYISEAFRQNWVAPLGPNVDGLEDTISQYLGVKHCAALSSGTAAIHLALIALGVTRGDYVIASSFTFSATVNPIVYQGAIPVFIDSEPGTWNMDPDLLEKAIKELRAKGEGRRAQSAELRAKGASLRSASAGKAGRRIKAIIAVHLYGMPAKMDRIMEIAEKYDIPVIEDAAEALGSRYINRQAGSFGKIGILSFNGNKIITTSGGGALVSDDEGLVKKARFLATQARDPAPHYQHSEIGFNYRMSNILAGIGRGQMEVINQRVEQRRANNLFYRENLKDIGGIKFLTEPDESYFSNYWLTTITIDPIKTGIDHLGLLRELENENIESRPLWKPMHLQPVFSGYPSYVNGTSESLFKTGLCLPSGSNMSDEDRSRIVDVLKRILRN